MTLVLNEIKQAKQIIELHQLGDKPSSTLFLLGKYFCQYENLKQEDIVKSLNEFMASANDNYNPILWADLIENISENAHKYPLRQIEHIRIKNSELEKIHSLNKVKLEKLLFVLLCYAKLHDSVSSTNNGWTNISIPDLFKEARVTVKYKNDKYLILNDLFQHGYISYSKKNENLNMQINYNIFDDCNSDDNDDDLIIDDFRELGYCYMNYFSMGDFMNCERCGILIPKKTNNQHYCKDCGKIVNVEKQKERDKKKKKS